MARKGIFVCTIILFFFRFGRATYSYCSYEIDCGGQSGLPCCYSNDCSYDFDCGSGEKCCNSTVGRICSSSCPTTSPSTYCTDESDCDQGSGGSCCSDGVCRRSCDSCSYDFECGTGEKCCGGRVCSSSCPTTSPSTYCTDESDCDQWSGESCCSDGVCRRSCDSCSYDFECGTGEKCCGGGDCLSSCPTTESPWAYATPVPFSPWNYLTDFPTLGTVAPISYCTFDSDCELDDVCCDGDCMAVCSSSWSGSGTVAAVVSIIGFFGVVFSIVACYYCARCPYYRYRSPGAVIVTGQVPYQPFVTTTHTTMTQNIPPPPNYNQPPPPGCQPPPPYSSYLQQPAQHPPPPAQVSGQPSATPKVTA